MAAEKLPWGLKSKGIAPGSMKVIGWKLTKIVIGISLVSHVTLSDHRNTAVIQTTVRTYPKQDRGDYSSGHRNNSLCAIYPVTGTVAIRLFIRSNKKEAICI